MANEYGIIVLKPEANTKMIKDKLIKRLLSMDAEIIEIRNKILSPHDIFKSFAINDDVDIDEYVNYMCSDKIAVFMLHGRMICEHLYNLKLDFRKEIGVSRETLKNMVHTSDQGNEFHLQFNIYFPEYEIASYCGYSDFNVRLLDQNSCETPVIRLNKIEEQTNLSYIALVVDAANTKNIKSLKSDYYNNGGNLKILYALVYTTMLNNRKVEIIGYFPESQMILPVIPKSILDNKCNNNDFIKWVKEAGGAIILDYLPYDCFDDDLFNELIEYGFDGVNTYDPRRTLREAEYLEDMVLDFKLVNVGGSSGVTSAGRLSLAEYQSSLFLSLFK